MDINKNGIYFSSNTQFTKNVANFGDTTLRLDCFRNGGQRETNTEMHSTPTKALDDDCRLVLGLVPTPSIGGYYPIMGHKRKAPMMNMLNQGLSSNSESLLKLSLSGSTDEDSNTLEHSGSIQSTSVALHRSDRVFPDRNRLQISLADEGSTSAKNSGGYIPSLLSAPHIDNREKLLEIDPKSFSNLSQLSSEPSAFSDYSINAVSDPTRASKSSENRTSNPKKCNFPGCSRGARGATNLCIGHGGGERCQKPGCNKGAESRTAYCKAHGGGKRCLHLGCTKSAEGKTEYCIAHGGGRRCEYPEGCTKAARGKSGLCIRHGGGKRCKVEGCTRSAEGVIGLCISHGGGRRCQFQGCNKGAQGSTMFCKAHGGGKRCIFTGCVKGAEGSTPLCKAHGGGKRCVFNGGGICPKSVHGGTNFCVAHGGGKRCSILGCTKSARGRTDCCVKHGGGKRCVVKNCEKSAQGSTDLCKAHGGGKRCCWGEGKCEKFARGKGGLCAAHSSIVNGRDKNKRGLIGPGLFHGLVPAASNATTSRSGFDNGYSSSAMSVISISDSIYSIEKPAKRQMLIPPQVLVPQSMKASPLSSENREERSTRVADDGTYMSNSFSLMIPEGRVHGGGLMSFLEGNPKNMIN